MPGNVRLFIAFRLLFNVRFYYPVFAILFLDYGLNLEQFALMNIVWAISIVCLEVPSGAVADHLGRKKTIVLAAICMIAEIALLLWVPLGNSNLVFWVFILNRILSGAAEALASGADEALAYDSIPKAEQTAHWPKVLDRLMKLQSFSFFCAMLIGAAVYDADFLNRLLPGDLHLTHETTMRFPLFLTFLSSLGVLAVSLAMKEEPSGPDENERSLSAIWRKLFETGRWILRTPFVLGILLTALLCDSFIRLYLTLGSQYYRAIHFPEASFGLIGSVFALLGFFFSGIAKKMAATRPAATNFLAVSISIFSGLLGISLVIPYFGAAFLLFFRAGFSFLNFFTSHYLNAAIDDSAKRATVLSFKGLALNSGFAAINIFYGTLLAAIARTHDASLVSAKDEIFAQSLAYLPWAFLLGFSILLGFYLAKIKRSSML